jgi:hypothetical protein
MTTRSGATKSDPIVALRDDPLTDVHRRLVAIHASVEEAIDDDPDIRRWSAEQLLTLIRDVGAARKAGTQQV